jgi:regulator of protease activity HflC (stomatin/prohibitin superfamily)
VSFWGLLGFLLLLALVYGLMSRFFLRRITVFEYQHALRFVRGRYAGVLAPGSHWILHPRTTIQLLDARPRIVTIPGQELLTADGVSLKLSILLELRVADPKAAALEAASYEQSLYARAQTALRTAVGEKPIEEVLQARASLSERLQAEVEPAARALGLELRSIGIKDIMFPGSLKEAFSQTARARQEAQAKLERARGETAALRNLANAARVFENNPGLFQLRLLQAVTESGKLVLTVTPPEAGAGNGTPGPSAKT